ncbi:unnamed protein product [Phyllotreta striolata]|uniref:Uncharacterized protein n=1 Tax=Phyllotreta striolata TaxID=444603 RepID=A0A9N9TM06_PHYSR|nr:unnamed protein product [Phyllotreta striolata]
MFLLCNQPSFVSNMKILIILASAILAATALSIDQQWNQFKITHKKSYETPEEEQLRYKIYQDNVEKINRHNSRYEAGLESYTMAANKFADLTKQEFHDLISSSRPGSFQDFEFEKHVPDESIPLPDEIDWRIKDKAVLPVRNQVKCSAGWAFSVAGALEGQNAIKNNVRTPISEQQLIDCDQSNQGCKNGSTVANAWQYAVKNGLASEYDYPYRSYETTCQAQNNPIVKPKKIVTLGKTEDDLHQAVGTVGPISAGIYFGELQFYSSGVFLDPIACPSDESTLDHDVLVVGYGSQTEIWNLKKYYWIIKNSWGQDWGEGGYFRLARNQNQCGIALRCSYPVL